MTKAEWIDLTRSTVLALAWLISPGIAVLVSQYVYFTPESKLGLVKFISMFGFYAVWVAVALPYTRYLRKPWRAVFFVLGVVGIVFCGCGTNYLGGQPTGCEREDISDARVRYKCDFGFGDTGIFEADNGSIFMSFVSGY